MSETATPDLRIQVKYPLADGSYVDGTISLSELADALSAVRPGSGVWPAEIDADPVDTPVAETDA